MEFEITHDNMFAIKNASLALTAEDILELAGENFKDDLVDGAEYVIMEVRDKDDDNFTNWFLVPKESLRAGVKYDKDKD